LPVQALYVNSKGTLHGTLSACVVDWAAGMAIASTGQNATVVSTDLSVSDLATAKEEIYWKSRDMFQRLVKRWLLLRSPSANGPKKGR
jgi:acyl-coenzyme A thioesterase PaaI-like protein